MSKPKIKEIKSINEVPDDEDGCVFYIQYDENLTQIMLTISAKRSMTPEEYVTALTEFVNEVAEFPGNLFVESVDNNEDLGLH